MSKNKSKRKQHNHPAGHEHPEGDGKLNYKPDHVTISGKVEADFPPKLVEKYDAANNKQGSWDRKKFFAEIVTIVLLFIYTTIAGIQACLSKRSIDEAKDNFARDQRAWISVSIPKLFAYDFQNQIISANIQIMDTGKTAATRVESDFIATVMSKGEIPDFKNFAGHPHNRFHAGAVYPNAVPPLDVPMTVVKYGPNMSEAIKPTPDLQKSIEKGDSFIVCFGRINYCDVFGVKHWTQFCNGSAAPLGLEWIKECIAYNDVDSDTAPSPYCQKQ
jgi:hypothetical protein